MKKSIYRILLLSLSVAGVILFGVAVGQKNSFKNMLNVILSKSTPTVKVQEARKQLGKAYFLDAREKSEFDVSHIKGARFVGVSDFQLSRIKDIPKTAPIIVYCSIGKRSEDLTLKLQKDGYTNIKNMYGGIFEWVNVGYPVYDILEKETTKVHAYNKFWGKWLEKGTKVY